MKEKYLKATVPELTSARAIRAFRAIVLTQVPDIRRKVRSIIRDRETNQQFIETHLEMLINIIPLGLCVDEFIDLSDYLFTLDPKAAEDYMRTYTELLEQAMLQLNKDPRMLR